MVASCVVMDVEFNSDSDRIQGDLHCYEAPGTISYAIYDIFNQRHEKSSTSSFQSQILRPKISLISLKIINVLRTSI